MKLDPKMVIAMKLARGYVQVNGTHHYILCFLYNGFLYAYIADIVSPEQLLAFVKLSKASRGQGYALRFRPNKKHDKTAMIHNGAIAVCSEEVFNAYCESLGHNNKGDATEWLITERVFNQAWHNSGNKPATDGGDVTGEDGTEYQIKFEGATFINERTLANFLSRA